MSRFWREGHYRTSRWGDVHWVEGHWVDRSDWSRWSYAPPPPPPAPATRQSVTTFTTYDGRRANFTIPNATCPVCGARVFFYQNDHGSRVFFDSLGPPWPKHPCTDQEQLRLPRAAASLQQPRLKELPDATRKLLETILEDRADQGAPVLEDGWAPFIVVRRSDRDGTSFFTVRPLAGADAKRLRVSTAARPDLPTADETVYVRGLQLSFFSFELFEPVEVPITLKVGKISKAGRRKGRRKRRARR